MANQDYFQEIAMTRHPISVTDKEVQPVPVPDIWFSQKEKTIDQKMRLNCKQKMTPWSELDFEQHCDQFYQELNDLRQQYASFMENHLPPLAKKVERMEFAQFEFRYLEPGEVFTHRNDSKKQWEQVTIPDYRGPGEEKGKWNGYYRCVFSGDFYKNNVKEQNTKDKTDIDSNKVRAVLEFQCVDYIAQIYVNGNYVGSHEGFFAPFSFDITDYLQQENELVILCKNDYTILGTGPVLDGDKIYAATGPGWDDPDTGWHHCPAGAGVFGKVTLACRPEVYVEDIFVRPDIDENSVEVRIGIYNYSNQVKEQYELDLNLIPRNYQGLPIGDFHTKILYVGPGKNEYRYKIPVQNYRLWNTETPWLYGAMLHLKKDQQVVSACCQTFGMKQFVSDETSSPKGKFYLNHKPIVLRGANEMGHLQQCIMKGDFNQLVDDILIAKMCHMNYYRVTQRPVQEEIYDYFDMLGMMHQCDLPLFSFLRRPQFSEAVRQAGEMEHLIRKHVSTCMVTFINEPVCIRRTEDPSDKFSKRYETKGHRHLLRDELEAFFVAARKAVYVENPDRVVKNVEGDYDGPTAEGMPDFHTYTMWYTNHGEPIGKLMRGYLPPVKEGWMIGCGEYGAEGLDNINVLREYCPQAWLDTDEQGRWYPDRIVRAQTHSVHGDWYNEQTHLEDWVRESQIHQANATKLMTDAFRRRTDVIQQTAIHLLIDAWPTGWMKTLVDCKRQPKRAFFAYQDSLKPVRVNLYTPRTCVYEDEQIPVEVWLLNDLGDPYTGCVQVRLWEKGQDQPYACYEHKGSVQGATSICVGKVPVTFEEGQSNVRTICVEACFVGDQKNLLDREQMWLTVYKRMKIAADVESKGALAEGLCQKLVESQVGENNRTFIISDWNKTDIDQIETYVKTGGHAILLLNKETEPVSFGPYTIGTKACGGVFFVAADDHYEQYPLGMLYDHQKDYIEMTATCTVDTDLEGEIPVYTYSRQGFNGSMGPKHHLPVVKQCMYGKGSLTLVSLNLDHTLGFNPGLDGLLQTLIKMK